MTLAPVLIIAAHPDDEVLGCGATIARLALDGHRVSVFILGDGATSRPGASAADVTARREQCQRAGALLGAHEVKTHDLPDNRFDTVALLDVVQLVERELARTKAGIVYTHHGGDVNIDHQITHRAVITATRTVPGQSVRDLYAFEIASSTEWAFSSSFAPFRPNVFVDVTRHLDTKLAALALYETEVRPPPHPRAPASVAQQAHRWGAVAGVGAAEAFELLRSVR